MRGRGVADRPEKGGFTLTTPALPIPLDGYLTWGFLNLSWPNVIVILVMIVVFVLALVLPFPSHKEQS